MSAARPAGATSRPAAALVGDLRRGHRGAAAGAVEDKQSPRTGAVLIRYTRHCKHLRSRSARVVAPVQPPCNPGSRSRVVS
jgi:hypothetical protein